LGQPRLLSTNSEQAPVASPALQSACLGTARLETMQVTKNSTIEFANKYYTRIRQIVPEEERLRLLQHAIDRSKTDSMAPDTRVPGTPAAYADPRMENLLEKLIPVIEEITELQLFPTYSYFRVYKNSDALGKHTDRFACEITASVNLGYRANSLWPIWIEGPRGPACIEMEAGDAVVYRGRDCPHWREPFIGEFAAQVFLHYVDQNGPLAAWKFDKRKRLASVPKDPISIAESVRSSWHAMLEPGFGSNEQNNLESLVWKDLEVQRPFADIVKHAVNELNMPAAKAEVAIVNFISRCEDKGLLVL
jgi:hypothetical protein